MTTQSTDNTTETAQKRFDERYICTSEICRELSVSRPAVLQARRRGQLPDPVFVDGNAICVWEREALAPYLRAWRLVLTANRGGVVTA